MADPVYLSFSFPGKAADCFNPPEAGKVDSCKVQMTDDKDKSSFVFERQGTNFKVSSADASKLNKAYPGFKTPASQLKDFILLNKEFIGVFGTFEAPSETMGKVKVFSAEQIAKIIDTTTNFLANGEILASFSGKRTQLEGAIRNFVSVFGDEKAGQEFEKLLKAAQSNGNLSSEAKSRAEFFLTINEARKQYWQALSSEMARSEDLDKKIKSASRDVLNFLFANHILGEKGYEASLNGDTAKTAAKLHYQLVSKIDPNYKPENNYYAAVLGIIPTLRKASISKGYEKGYFERLDVMESEYKKLARLETVRILDENPDKYSDQDGFRSYMRVRYGDTPIRREAIDVLLKHLKVKVMKDNSLNFDIPMATVSEDFKKWVKAKPADQQGEATTAVLYVLTELFERNGKMEIYWDKKVQNGPNLYYNSNIPMLGDNKTYLEKLIKWARGSAKETGADVPKGEKPHVGFRKYTAIGEGVVGIAGFATFGGMMTMENTQDVYYGRMASVIGGGMGVGALLGNSISYAADVDEYDWLFDAGGSIVGGVLAGVLYGTLAPKPNATVPIGPSPNPFNPCPPSDKGNCNKNPVDPYGQSLSFGKGFGLTMSGRW